MRLTKSGGLLFLRHQLGGAIASVVDLGVMTFLVEVFGLRPSLATAAGALIGGITNFIFSRHVVFRAQKGAASHQAFRYVVVSGASLLLNAGGEWLLAEHFGIRYFVARLMVSFVVSVAWNFPMHRYFVFADRSGKDEVRAELEELKGDSDR